jgi:uncharacterized protein YhbP (UPF0306 family)
MTAQGGATDFPADVFEYLQTRHTLTLSTASSSGLPHAATFVYVNDGLAFYFATLPDTRTAQNIEQNPVVAFTIDQYYPDWRATKGIQAGGECQALANPDEIHHIVDLFQHKFPHLTQHLETNHSFFRISPTEVFFIDNEGLTDERQELTSYRRSLVFSVFRDLPVTALESVEAKLESRSFEAGQIVVRQGTPADRFFIVVDGEVEVVHEDGDQTRSVNVLKAGEFFGEIAILRDTPRTATVRALTPTTLMAMDRDTFRGLVAQALGTTHDFGAVIQQRLDRSSQLNQEIEQKT